MVLIFSLIARKAISAGSVMAELDPLNEIDEPVRLIFPDDWWVLTS